MRYPLITVGIWLGAAGSLVAQTPAESGIDGCALAPGEAVEEVIGEKLQRRPRPKRLTMLSVESYGCNYKSAGWTVEVRLETGRSKDELKGYFKTLKGVVKQTTATDARAIDGLGDEAWWGPISPTNGILSVGKGGDLLWVQTYGKAPGAGSLEKTRLIVNQVLANYGTVRKR